MSDAPVSIHRPQRWDSPFGPDMTDSVVDRALAIGPLSYSRWTVTALAHVFLTGPHGKPLAGQSTDSPVPESTR